MQWRSYFFRAGWRGRIAAAAVQKFWRTVDRLRHPDPATVLRALAFMAVVLAIVWLGSKQVADKLAIVKPIAYIGHADEASYALQGRSIAEGHGTRVNYVSTFFIPYPRGITHREDHWPAFMGYSIAPFFYWMGVSAQVARIPGILYGSIGLPLAAGLLAFALSRRGYVALVTALLMMAIPDIYLHSMRTLSDVANAMLLAGFLGCVFLTRKHPWLHVPTGLLMACAYFSKGSEILLFGLYPLLAVLAAGWGTLGRRHFYIGMAAALLLMALAWVANWRDYGNPFHTTQNYVAAFFGFEDWETEFYAPYWGKNLPRVSDRWEKHANYWAFSRSQVPLVARAALDGAIDRPEYLFSSRAVWSDFGDYGQRAREWLEGPPAKKEAARNARRKKSPAAAMKPIGEWTAPVPELTTLAALGALVIALLASPIAGGLAIARWVKRRGASDSESAAAVDEEPQIVADATGHPGQARGYMPESRFWMIGPVMGTWLVIVIHLGFIAYFWKYEARFCFPVVPLLLALGCTAFSRVVEWPAWLIWRGAGWALAKWRKPRGARWWPGTLAQVQRFGAAAITLLAAAVLVWTPSVRGVQQRMLAKGYAAGHYPFYSGRSSAMTMGEWIGKHLPGAVVMCRGPWELLFYASPHNKGVGLPAPRQMDEEGAEEIFAIARYYGVTHLYVDSMRPSLYPYIYGRKAGLKRVKGAPGALYVLDWSKLPGKTVEDFWGR